MLEKRLINVNELSAYISMPRATIYTYVCLGKIPADCIVKIGRTLKFDIAAIDRWVEGLRSSIK